MVSLVSDAGDGIHREVGPLKVTPFKLPDGCVASYYPEMNPLMALVEPRQAVKDAGDQVRSGQNPRVDSATAF